MGTNPSFQFVEYEERNSAAIIRFDRPEKLNAMNVEMRKELVEGIHLAEDGDVRAVVISGNGGSFSSGYDFGSGAEETQFSIEDYIRDEQFYHGHLGAIFQSPLPIIAAVEGYALAGACNLTCACDITIAAEDAEFGYPDMHMGTLPDILIHPYIGVGAKHAKELFFSGKHVDAREAERIGLVNRVVPGDDLWESVWEEVEHISLTPSMGVTLAKVMINDSIRQMGFRYPDGKLDEYLQAFSMKMEASQTFEEIKRRDGLQSAMEWMNTAEKE